MLAKVLEHYGADMHRVREVGWCAIKCCFHDDRSASASVNLDKDGFRCHACGVSGDALKIIMTQEGIGYIDALAFAETVLGESQSDLRRPVARETIRERSKWRDTLFS
jgi:DNA primase